MTNYNGATWHFIGPMIKHDWDYFCPTNSAYSKWEQETITTCPKGWDCIPADKDLLDYESIDVI